MNKNLLWYRQDGYLFDKEAILEYILHQKREISKKLKEFEKQKSKQQVWWLTAVFMLLCMPSLALALLHTHTHPFNGPFSGTTRVSRYQKGKTNLDLLKQETVSGSGISWAICKSAPSSRQITTPAPHHLVFLQAGCPSCRPTNSVKALKANCSGTISW